MIRLTITTLTILILGSCRSGVGIRKANTNYFDSSFSVMVNNKSFKIKDQKYKDRTLLNLFKINEEKADTVYMSFNNSKELKITFTDKGQTITKTFAGEFTRRGYFEIYFSNKRIEIPPLLPIIYSNNNIDRIRIALTIEGDLIVDNKWDHSGSIFLLAGGGIGRQQSYFKCKYTY